MMFWKLKKKQASPVRPKSYPVKTRFLYAILQKNDAHVNAFLRKEKLLGKKNMIYELEDTSKAARIFEGWRETRI